MKLFAPVLLLAFALIAITHSSFATAITVWQIGSFDKSHAEFAISPNFGAYTSDFPKDVTFHPTTDKPAKNWPFIHPGPIDGWSGSRMHPFTILFDLKSEPAGTYKLKVALVDTHSGFPPRYQIDINGRIDSIRLPSGATDASITDGSKGKNYTLELSLPAHVFKMGENRIVLTVVDGSWLLYDALQLTNDPLTVPQPTITNLELKPTIRLVNRAGKLKQIVEISAVMPAAAPDCRVEYTVGTVTSNLPVRPGLFGFVSDELEIDEPVSRAKISAKLHCGNVTKAVECEVKPPKHWKIYVMASTHVDIGYTDIQPNIIKRHNENTSLALDLMRKYPDFKWNTEAAWTEDNYLTMMPSSRRDEFIKRAKEGRLGCQVVFGSMLTGICSHEELFRNLYSAKFYARKYGIPFDMAISSDVPTQVWTVPTVLAASGIKYFATGINATRGESIQQMLNKSPFYWQGSDGSKVLSWFASGYGHASMLGLADSVSTIKQQTEGFTIPFNRADYPYDAVFAFGGFGDNLAMDARIASVTADWNKRYAFPQIIICRGPEFFNYIESKYGAMIPTIRGDAGVYWEDGAGSSAHETAISRQAKERLITAEKLFSLASINGKTAYPAKEITAAWRDAILYDEHTWGAGGSIDQPESDMTVKQWEYKNAFAVRASASADLLQRAGLDALAKTVSADNDSTIVFNPHSWTTSGPVVLNEGETFWADDIPAMGYRLFPRRSAATPAGAEQAKEPYVIENSYYRLEFDPSTGAVRSLFDKELTRELADTSAKYGINQYIYMAGHDKNLADITGIANVTFKLRKTGYAQVMEVSASAFKTPSLHVSVILYDSIKRIDFNNEIDKTATYDKEAGYFAFPFAMTKPEFHLDLPNGTVSPNTDMLPGACMQWYSSQDYAAVHDAKSAVVWSAIDSPLLTICDINRDAFVSPLPITNGHIYGYVFNNYWFTNYKASQGGMLSFRFSITSERTFDPAFASRFGQSVRSPLLAVDSAPSRSSIKKPTAFFAVNGSSVVIQTIKKAETGKGYIVRLRETSGKSTNAVLSIPSRFKSAWRCNAVEDPLAKLKTEGGQITVNVPARGSLTVMVR